MPATWVPGPLLQTQEEHAAYLVAPNAAPLLLCYRPALVQAEELDARILGAIIAGVRRAFPFVAGDDVEPLVQRHSDALFRMWLSANHVLPPAHPPSCCRLLQLRSWLPLSAFKLCPAVAERKKPPKGLVACLLLQICPLLQEAN